MVDRHHMQHLAIVALFQYIGLMIVANMHSRSSISFLKYIFSWSAQAGATNYQHLALPSPNVYPTATVYEEGHAISSCLHSP